MDLDQTKKALISVLNINPKGILADKLNQEYKSHCGENIPFSRFGYSSVLVFLENELNGCIRIENNGWDIMVYPVGTENSAHILKFKANENPSRGRGRRGQGHGHGHGHSSQPQSDGARQQSQPTPECSPVQEKEKPQAPRDASPSMPELRRYRPFPKPNTGNNPTANNVFRNAYLRSRLVESQKAYIARNRLTARAALKKTTPPAQNNRPTQSNVHQKQQSNVHQKQQSNDSGHSQSNETSSNHQQSLPSKPSEVSGMHSRFVAALALHEQNKLAQTQTSVDVPKKPQSTPNASRYQASVATANTNTQNTVKSTPIQVSDESNEDHDADGLWDDEMENLQPPTMNRSNPSSFYCVSDPSITSTASSKSSTDPAIRQMRELTSEEDEVKVSDIPDLLSEFQPGDMHPARVSDTNNPLKFWVHIRLEKYMSQLNEMHKALQKFYSVKKNSEELKIKSVEEADSGYFAVEFLGQWHRVEPYDTPMGAAIRCSFLDYGSRETINFDKLRRLDKQFWKTPKAAVCCGLGNIKPIGSTFSTRSANDFVNIVEDQKLYAKFLHIDHSKKKAMVELIMHKDKLSVNDKLVELNHAVQKSVRANA